jgi:CheY-like chemotaxis protein
LETLNVVVLTSSAEQRDLAKARSLGARHYLVKPPRAKTLGELIAMFRAEWEGAGRSEVKIEGDLFTKIEAKV